MTRTWGNIPSSLGALVVVAGPIGALFRALAIGPFIFPESGRGEQIDWEPYRSAREFGTEGVTPFDDE